MYKRQAFCNLPVDDGVDAEFAPGLERADVRCRERVRRRATGYLQPLHVGERIGDLVGELAADVGANALRRTGIKRQYQEPGQRRRRIDARAQWARSIEESHSDEEDDAADGDKGMACLLYTSRCV